MTPNNQPTAAQIAAGLSAEELAALERVATFENIEGEMLDNLKRKGLIVIGKRQIDVTVTGQAVLATRETPQPKLWETFNPVTISAPAIDEWATKQPVNETAEGYGADGYETQAELCEREIVKIRSLTLKDDEYTGGLLADAVSSPVGITMCVEARMKQIADLQEEIKRLKKQIKKLERKSDLDDGFIDHLTQESEE